MKLKIEKWVEANDIFKGVQLELFNEAVICYKVGAYRSAFMMSYLAFKITVRDRILEIDFLPQNYSNYNHWESAVLNPLKDENNWENKLNDIVTMNKQSSFRVIVFDNHDDDVKEYEYWKKYRNSVAHAKSKQINSSTVEHFWNYLMDNLSKFYVCGGREYLLNRFLELYQYNQTIPLTELDKVLTDIGSLYKSSIDTFFNDVFKILSEIHASGIIERNNTNFWDKIINNTNLSIRDGFYKAIVDHKKYFFNVYTYYETIFEWMVSYDKRFIIDIVLPRITDFRCTDDINWKLLYLSLLQYNTNMDVHLKKITDSERWLRSIDYINIEPQWIDTFNNKLIFKNMILNAGEYYFKNHSESHYTQYCHNQWESYVEPWFIYLEWDNDLLNRFKNATDLLASSVLGRTSKSNGYRRRDSYLKVIHHAKSMQLPQEILNTLQDIEKTLNSII